MRRSTGRTIAAATIVVAAALTLVPVTPSTTRALSQPGAAHALSRALEGGTSTARTADAADRRSVTPAVHIGGLSPDRPVQVASVDVGNGRYVVRLRIAARFSALTGAPLECYVVEQTSGVAIEPKVTLRFDPSGPWQSMRSDVPLSLPEMTLAANCTTASPSFGRLEVLRAVLIAEPV